MLRPLIRAVAAAVVASVVVATAGTMATVAARAQSPEPAAPDVHALHGGAAHVSGGLGGHMAGLPRPAAADVASPAAVVAAYYQALSGPAGAKRDWNRFLSLFFPGARLLPAEGKGHTGTMPHSFSPSQYLFAAESEMLATGYVLRETTARRSEGFGKILHVWSPYEGRHAAADPRPFVRGVNSFELFSDGERWWIFAVVWQPETAKLSLAEERHTP